MDRNQPKNQKKQKAKKEQAEQKNREGAQNLTRNGDFFATDAKPEKQTDREIRN